MSNVEREELVIDLSTGERTARTIQRASPTDAERAALLILDRTDFLFALAAAVGQSPVNVVSYVSGVIDASALDDDDKITAKFLIQQAARFHRVDPDLGSTLLEAVGALLSLTPSQIDTMFLSAAGQI